MKLITALLFLFCMPVMADYPLEIIELKGRDVAEIIPLIRPLVGEDGAVTGMNNQLIIRTSPENLGEIRRILEQVDRAPRRLIVSVRPGIDDQTGARKLAADVNVMVGKNTKIIVGQPTREDTVRLTARKNTTRSDLDVTHRVQTMEGYPAFIATGKSVPIHHYRRYWGGPYPPRGELYTQYRDVTTGFYVTPRLNGDRVTLEVSPHMERLGRMERTFDIQRARTVVGGNLGEWIAIGGAERSAGGDGTGIARSVNTRNRQQRDIYIKVEERH